MVENAPIIEFSDVSFKYRAQQEPTLKNINLKIYPGEKILIAGQSGSGKSTLAHCLNALIPCSYAGDMSGTLRVCGEEPNKLGVFGMSQIVGTVLQDTDGQFIALTVAEDLAFALENDNVPQEEMFQKVDEVSEKLELKPFLGNAPGALSGGQKQRVSLGGVMACDVKILLFDEPLANLDPATGKKTISLIDDIMHNEDMTVVIIEHRLEDVLYKDVDRVILMDGGRIIADMHPDELLCSDVLTENGIREPLYISALKAAGAKLSPDTHPQHIETMDIAPYKDAVKKWYHEAKFPASEKNSETLLEVSHLKYSYDESRQVIDDVSFEIKKGEMISLVGKNGAGKSTLASLICGFNKPDGGVIKLSGKDIADLSIKQRGEKIGYVMQSPNQMISKPMIFDEVSLGLASRGVPEDEIKEKVNEILKICGLYPFRNWPVSALSFGQKKRVSIASILVMEPELLILDEPTAGQDYRHYTEIMEFIHDIRKKMPITIIMITHDMHLMLEYTDRALVLTDGKLLMNASPAEVLTDNDVCDRAYLKRTSLYDLSVKCGIDDASEFAARFIEDERRRK
ncbi:ABC transporter ATP-binding protein [Butyrivibrio sp. INlla21]|uniref:ABC transporter ATP-binding protein n=1 Tax=Butyrivibrio sp. INlla21 TaxID=1520811 RepID=UPI0008EDEA3D|nr:ABC transporter ATP-binding protein [Butyrivibrio sp. INlla21]SFU58095.1 energy-coupling factor transport system ATP-binding protein [Butyrivibrio sp. INlla21]